MTTTVIRCAASSGKVVLEDGCLCWYLNDEDGLGQHVWHLALPPQLLRDLGANVVALMDALNAAGLGLAVQHAQDRDQQLGRMRADDERLRWGGPR